MLTRLANIDPAITYNLMLATIFSASFTLVYSIVSNLLYLLGKVKISAVIWGGALSSMLVNFGGNLHTVIFANLIPMIHGVKADVKYWYPDATRYIGYNPPTDDKTIHEFLSYSHVVADLHAHLMDVLFVLTILALTFHFILRMKDEGWTKKWYVLSPEQVIMIILLPIMYMTNAWDFPIYLTVAGFAFLYINIAKYGLSVKALMITAVHGIFTLVMPIIFSLPFTLNFKNIAGGISFVSTTTPIYQLLVLWGYQLFFAVLYVYSIFIRKETEQEEPIKKKDISSVGKKITPVQVISNHGKEITGTWWNKIENFISGLTMSDAFIVILLISAFGLILIPEVIYVKDIYTQGYARANTMFKLTFQSFTMLGVAIGYMVARVLAKKRSEGLHMILEYVVVIVLACPMVYPFWSIGSYYGNLAPSNYKGLNGLSFISQQHPDDYKAIQWLEENIKDQPVVLEANGESYTYYNRISMATGLPTIRGWTIHEWLWRGDKKLVDERADEITTVYESDDMTATRNVLQKYNVKYIIIGQIEREKFKNIKQDKLNNLGTTAFESGSTKIIRIAQ